MTTEKNTAVVPFNIDIQEGLGGQQMVSARELHSFLGSRQQFADWIKSRIADYGFQDGEDYFISLRNRSEGHGKPNTEYTISLDMAKELCMLERSEMGRRVRRYFIDVERMARQAVYQGGQSLERGYTLYLYEQCLALAGSDRKLGPALGISDSHLGNFRANKIALVGKEKMRQTLLKMLRYDGRLMEADLQLECDLLRLVVRVPSPKLRDELLAWWETAKQHCGLLTKPSTTSPTTPNQH